MNVYLTKVGGLSFVVQDDNEGCVEGRSIKDVLTSYVTCAMFNSDHRLGRTIEELEYFVRKNLEYQRLFLHSDGTGCRII